MFNFYFLNFLICPVIFTRFRWIFYIFQLFKFLYLATLVCAFALTKESPILLDLTQIWIRVLRMSGYGNKFCVEKLMNSLNQRSMAGYGRFYCIRIWTISFCLQHQKVEKDFSFSALILNFFILSGSFVKMSSIPNV